MSSSRSTGDERWAVIVDGRWFRQESGSAAFRVEAQWRARGSEAYVYHRTGEEWWRVDSSSYLRADPVAPGPRAVGWLERWRKRLRFRPSDGRGGSEWPK